MSDAPTLLYLEADDEITAVVRRVRAAAPGRVVVVAPGRARATSSVVALRLLARARGDGRDVAVVGDALTRSLAAEAGLPAFATVDDARRADDSAGEAAPARHAMIHVVRGPGTDDSAPTLAAAQVAIGSDDVTRPVPVTRRPRRVTQARRTARARSLPAAALAAVGLLLAAAVGVGAVLLPAASVTLAVRAEPIEPIVYSVSIDDVERDAGTVEAEATVTATGTYPIQEPATGAVVLYNWTFFPVTVPAGTFVAAGEQAFATQADVLVPRGRLTAQGTIAAGAAEVPVVAAAAGPAANVPANAINVVVNEAVDDQLGGVPENPEPRVLNPEPTTGGIDDVGPEFTQADVDAAVTGLQEQLAELARAATASGPDEVSVTVGSPESVLAGIEGLVGTRDQAEAAISGTLAWEVVRTHASTVRDAALAALPDELPRLPAGHELVEGPADVEVLDATAAGDEGLAVEVRVTASSAARVDTDAIPERIAGLDPEAARTELADIGEASVTLWPAWVSTVPGLAFRVTTDVIAPGPEPSPPAPSASAAPSSP